MKKEVLILIGMITLISIVGVVMAADDSKTATASVTVNSFLSVTLSNAPVTFPNMDPGTGPTAATVGTGYPLTATIGNESNVDADVKTKADDANFVCASGLCTVNVDNFAVSNMEWSETDAGTYLDYTTSDATVCTSVAALGTCDIYHQLTIPSSAQAAGTYDVGIIITAIGV